MPAPFGLVDTGFSYETIDEILTDVEADEVAQFGPIDTDPESNFGQYNGIQSERLNELWQLLRSIYAGLDPDTSTGRMLDNMMTLIGISRLPATKTRVLVRFFGTNGTFVDTGKSVQIPNGEKFTTAATGTVGDVVSGYVDVRCDSDNTGPILALANTITQLNSPISGITSINNPTDQYLLGANIESSARMRARRLASIQALGTDQLETIKAKLLDLSGVIDVYVAENYSNVTDASGIPPHSFQPVVDGGNPADIAAVLMKYRSFGIVPYGSSHYDVTDSQGTSVRVYYDIPNNQLVYINIEGLIYNGDFPTNGEALIQAALVAWAADNLRLGREIRSRQLIPTIFAACPGIVDTGEVDIGLSAWPVTDDTLVMGNKDKPIFQSANIRVHNPVFGSFS